MLLANRKWEGSSLAAIVTGMRREHWWLLEQALYVSKYWWEAQTLQIRNKLGWS
jgi:hypothetical protein